jgi:pimeloyl-ACP methyl ester carboxylesterase
MAGYSEMANLTVTSARGTTFAYRDTGGDGMPILGLQHFRGTLDGWDPELVDALSGIRRVITFDNVGVAGSSGIVPRTIAEMANGALEFMEALELDSVDVLGFSIGSFVAQELALMRPDAVNKVVLASSAPKGAPGMHGWSAEVMSHVGPRRPGPDAYLNVFFTPSEASQAAGKALLGRVFGGRTEDRDADVTWQCRLAQYDAVCEWGEPNVALLERLQAITMPVFIANGDSDPMILPKYSYLLAGLLPNSALKIYPDAAHGFLFQHNKEFAADVLAFLGS